MRIPMEKIHNKIVQPHTGTITYQKERWNLTDIETERHWTIQKEIKLYGEENKHASETPQQCTVVHSKGLFMLQKLVPNSIKVMQSVIFSGA